MRTILLLWLLPALCMAQGTVNVGSKRFTESYILGEIVTGTIRRAGEAHAAHQRGMGNTAIVFAALKNGAIDVYPEYTGTIAFELLRRGHAADLTALNRELAPLGLAAAVPLGFNNSYALAMLESQAAPLGIQTISDLLRHPDLNLAVSQEFLNRRDGWPALRSAYGLPFAPRGLDHGLAYEALAAGKIDAIDVYSTDAKVAKYALRVLADDRNFFPAYEAVLLYRLDLPQRFPRTWAALRALEGTIPAERMVSMNAAAEISGATFTAVADGFLAAAGAAGPGAMQDRGSLVSMMFAADFWRVTLEHLALVFASLALSVAAGIPLGVWAARAPRCAPWILAAVGLLQTVPSLALLAFLIAAMGMIGAAPAIVALFLYALLPIVRNTASGLADIPAALRESAEVLGLPSGARLRRIELPLAARAILAGIKTSAVINVGMATIAAFIGAGGYGDRIVAGLAVNDHGLMLAGALPAAALALLIQGGFDLLERRAVPAGLQERGQPSAR